MLRIDHARVVPLSRYFRRMPAAFQETSTAEKARLGAFFRLFRIPSLRTVTLYVSVATFGLFLVWSWLPTFLYDKFHLGLARAGFEASIYSPVGTALGLIAGGTLADRGYARTPASRFWLTTIAFFAAAPCILLLGASPTLGATRIAAIGGDAPFHFRLLRAGCSVTCGRNGCGAANRPNTGSTVHSSIN
jgi:predicted MFS family arabinose efflux permease